MIREVERQEKEDTEATDVVPPDIFFTEEDQS